MQRKTVGGLAWPYETEKDRLLVDYMTNEGPRFVAYYEWSGAIVWWGEWHGNAALQARDNVDLHTWLSTQGLTWKFVEGDPAWNPEKQPAPVNASTRDVIAKLGGDDETS